MNNTNNNTMANNESMKGGVNMNNNTVVNGGIEMNNVMELVIEMAAGRKHITKVERDEEIVPAVLTTLNVEGEEAVKMIKKAVAAYNKGIKVEEVKETKEDIKAEIMEEVYEEINYDSYAPMSKKLKEVFFKKHSKDMRKIAADAIKVQILSHKRVADLSSKEFTFLMNNMPSSMKKAELLADYMRLSKAKSYVKQLALEAFTKEMKVNLKNRIEVNVEKDNYGNEVFIKRVMVEPSQESELSRSCDTFEGTMADEAMTLDGTCITDICSISMGTQLRNNKSALIGLFSRLIGCHKNNEKVFVLFKKSGLSKTYFCTNEYMKNIVQEGEYALEYQLLGITPSGLRTGSITLASVAKFCYGDKEWTNIDKRIELLDKASNNAFSMNFVVNRREDGTVEYKKYSTLVKLFKAVTRVMMVATPSKKIGTVRSYIVLDNIASGAGYDKNNYFKPATKDTKGADFIDCKNTKDGTCFISVEMVKKFLQESKIPTAVKELLGVCIQARGGGNKNSSQIITEKNIQTLILALMERGAKIERMVIDGKDVDFSKLTEEEFIEYTSKLDGLFDANCMKLIDHDEEFDLVCLKKAHQSNTGLNMVINIMMLLQDEPKAIEYIQNRAKKSVMDKFEELGAYIKLSDDCSNIKSIDIDFEKFARMNNDGQTANWLYKSSPKEILAWFPGVIKSMLNNIVTSTGNMLNILKGDVDADYSVIQADPAPLFGVRLLDDGECFCPKFEEEGIEKVSAARHPISGHKSISTFKVVTLDVLLERVQRMEISNTAKKFLSDYLLSMDGFVLIPADHFLMEKHDGADFDIDSMQFFKDPVLVSIMQEIEDFGTIVDRTKDEHDELEGDISHNESQTSMNIAKFLTGENERIVKAVIRKAPVKTARKAAFGFSKGANVGKTDMKEAAAARKTKVKKVDGGYLIDFENTGRLILDYFLNPVAPVGFISTGFYNNALLLLALRSKFTPQAVKEHIAYVISKRFKVSKEITYISPVKTDASYKTYTLRNGQSRTQVKLNKRLCEEVMVRYAQSMGTIEETIAFLEDACICNRYPGETSIDAAKNMYQVVDMFNLKDIIKATGSDKNMATVQEEDEDISNNIFEENVEILNEMIEGEYTTNNFFNVKLLKNKIKKENTFMVTEELTKEEINEKLENELIPVVEDSLGRIREEMVQFSNLAITLIAKELEVLILSPKSEELRENLKIKHDDVLSDATGKTKKFKAIDVIRSVIRMFIGITETLTDVESVNVLDGDLERQITANKYIKTAAMQICRNYAELAFLSSETPLTEEEIGCSVVYYGITKFEKDKGDNKCATINSNVIKIFEKELVAFLKSEGLNIVAAEKILYASNEDNKTVSLKDIVGQTVTANKGHGVAVDEEGNETLLVFDNKKASFASGTVITDDKGHFFVETERACVESDYNRGVYLPMIKQSINPAAFKAKFVSYAFNKESEPDMYTGKVEYNIMTGTTENGEVIEIGKLWLNAFVAGVLDSLDFSNSKVNFFVSEKSACMYLKNAKIFEIAAEQKTSVTANQDAINQFLMDGVVMPGEETDEVVNNNDAALKMLMEGIVMPGEEATENNTSSNVVMPGDSVAEAAVSSDEKPKEEVPDFYEDVVMPE